eukprot:CAMPEP_0117623126 /NCGR_PEP_ID=MMETSP0784-20121206/88490_1 /TAXON_ID=39447 /ORGANISM="" /LENGTH=373 /DNA_ID=CAMNT_0005427075 /DNA_START=66 /DNA_END=1184 /DNA_ORIENTATION=-
MSPKEEVKPHTHVIRVTKDGCSALHYPDISFAVAPSTMRQKLLRCIGFNNAVECPRETLLKMPHLKNILAKNATAQLTRRMVTGHVTEPGGLLIQLSVNKPGGERKAESNDESAIKVGKAKPRSVELVKSGSKAQAASPKAGEMTSAMRAQLRAKYGKGKMLVRHGRMVTVRTTNFESTMLRCVVSVYERPAPYQHFVMAASANVQGVGGIADSIDIFKLFIDRGEERSSALDLANPRTRLLIAEILVDTVELEDQGEELVLVVSPEAIRDRWAKSRKRRKDTDTEPERTGKEGRTGRSVNHEKDGASSAKETKSPTEPFQVQPAISRTQMTAVGGFTGGFQDRETKVQVVQRLSDRLFAGQRRLHPTGKGPG